RSRARVVGRAPTARGGVDGVRLTPGLHAELGGESIDESHVGLLGLLTRFGIATERRPGSTRDRVMRGRLRSHRRNRGARELMAQRGGELLRDYVRAYTELERLTET